MTLPPEVWCNTCVHRHVWNMPAHTWQCEDCGFGAHSPDIANSHAEVTGHKVYVVFHEMKEQPVSIHEKLVNEVLVVLVQNENFPASLSRYTLGRDMRPLAELVVKKIERAAFSDQIFSTPDSEKAE